MKCNVKSLVYYEHSPNDFVVEHSHSCYECVFYCEGMGAIAVEKEAYTYSGPTLTIMSPGSLHDEKTNQKSKLYIVLFDLDGDIQLEPFNIFKVSKEDEKEITLTFEMMRNEEKEKKPYYQEIISSLFSSIIFKYLRTLTNVKVSSNKELVERTKTYIKENYRQDIDFEKVAFNIGYSFDRFRHIFKQETGVSIYQYLLNCRLYAAKQMLLDSNLTVKEVARNCGFDSVIHFNNFFKSKMNTSPIQFRKSSRTQIDKGVFTIDNAQNKTLIIDTDIGGDCDDAGALALANIFYNQNKIDILCMTFTTSSPYGPGCIDAINSYYGNHFEIGATDRTDFVSNHNIFQEELCKNFPNDFYDLKAQKCKKAANSVSLMRKKLANAQDQSVTIVCIGQLNNASDLLDSKPDEYSSLPGVDLVKKKVREFVVMGGMFKTNDEPIYFYGNEYKSEYNIVTDVKSAQNFISKCPVKVYFVDFLCGYQIKTGGSLLNQNNEANPVTIAYRLFQNSPRESWDLLTLWFAVFGKSNFFKVSKEGKISISDDGVTTFSENEKCHHFYLSINNTNEFIVDKIDAELIKEGKPND